MSSNNSKPTSEIIFYGKKIFHLDINLAQKIDPEQLKMNFIAKEEAEKNRQHR